MTRGNADANELHEKIRLAKENIALLEEARKDCTCDDGPAHYHVLVHYDSESGDAYIESSDTMHQRFIAKLKRNLERLEAQHRESLLQ